MSIKAKGFIGYCACGCGQPLITVGTSYRRNHILNDPVQKAEWLKSVRTPEYRAKQSVAQSGKKQSEETKQKMAESHKRYWDSLTEEEKERSSRSLRDGEVRARGVETRKRLFQEDPEFRKRRLETVALMQDPEIRARATKSFKKKWDEDREYMELKILVPLHSKESRVRAQVSYNKNKDENDARRAEGLRRPEVRRKIARTLTGRKQPREMVENRARGMRKYWAGLNPEDIKRLREAMHQGIRGFWDGLDLDEKRQRVLNSCGSEVAQLKAARQNGMRPNKPEATLMAWLNKHYPNEWVYNGRANNGTMIGGHIPDFVNVDGRKAVIEVYGNYWHDPEKFPDKPSEDEIISHCASWGFACLVLWESEVYNKQILRNKLGGFLV